MAILLVCGLMWPPTNGNCGSAEGPHNTTWFQRQQRRHLRDDGEFVVNKHRFLREARWTVTGTGAPGSAELFSELDRLQVEAASEEPRGHRRARSPTFRVPVPGPS